MALRESEAIVLRTYPVQEADLLVTLFTRVEGKVRGVARSAKKSKRRFGGALEPLTYVRAHYDQKERRELVRLDSCEVLDSPLSTQMTYPRAVAIGHVAELLDELLADHDANDAVFRLALAAAAALHGPDIWTPLTYFQLWMTRLMGYLPDTSECIVCGSALGEGRAFFHVLADGLTCSDDKRLASSELTPSSRTMIRAMLRAPLGQFSAVSLTKQDGADLRKFLLQSLQRHLDKKLITAVILEKL